MRKGIKESTLNWGEFKGSQKGRNGFESRGPGWALRLKSIGKERILLRSKNNIDPF